MGRSARSRFRWSRRRRSSCPSPRGPRPRPRRESRTEERSSSETMQFPARFWVVRVHAAPTPPPSDRAAVELLPAGAALQPPLRSPALVVPRSAALGMDSGRRGRELGPARSRCETRPRGCGLSCSRISSGPSAGAGVRRIATPPRSSAIGWVWAPTRLSRRRRAPSSPGSSRTRRGRSESRFGSAPWQPRAGKARARRPRPRSPKDFRSGPHPPRSPAIASSCSADGCTPT